MSANMHPCPRCHAPVVLRPAEVKTLVDVPWVVTDDDAVELIESVICDDCDEWYGEWKRPDDLLDAATSLYVDDLWQDLRRGVVTVNDLAIDELRLAIERDRDDLL